MSSKDPYEILGVSRTADADEIKRAYRRLAKQHHPDRNPGNPQAAEQFKEVQAAYEVLGDPQRRQQFDQFGAGGPRPDFHHWDAHTAHRHGGDMGFDFGNLGDLSSIFEQFFAGAASRGRGRGRGSGVGAATQPPQPGANLEHRVQVTFEEALHGTKREIVLSSPEGGTERIEFRVPAGVKHGQKIRVRGKGNPGMGGRGDLIITCAVESHRFFRREGDDLYIDAPLTITEATLGTKLTVPTLSGSGTVSIPPGTPSGAKLRLRGHGVPTNNGTTSGDLFVVIKIQPPKELSPQARELLEALQAELDEHPRAQLGWNT